MKRLLAFSLAVVLALMLPMAPVSADDTEVKLTAGDDGAAEDQFGWSVSISGDYAVVGAPYDDGDSTDNGSAYVFVRSEDDEEDWNKQAKLTADDGAAEDQFGNSVSISGDYAVVGAPGADINGNENAGAAYVFKRTGTTWGQQAKLIASDNATRDLFGNSVSISGDYVVVGAYLDDDNGSMSGSAYVFKRSGDDWNEQDKLTADDSAAGDMFGTSVSISGDYAVVGARLGDGNVTNSGSAYVFKRSGEDWDQQDKLTADDGAKDDYFGNSVSISGDYVVVGAHQDNFDGKTDAGSAYVFKRSGEDWDQQDKLTADDSAASDYFGISVSISGAAVVVGSYRDDIDSVSSVGSAYVFVRSEDDGEDWGQQAKLTADDGAKDDFFGYSVSIGGGTVVVGAYYDDDDGYNSGSAYVYTVPQYTLTITPQGEGSVSQAPLPPYYQGANTQVTLTAYPADGYTFAGWSGDLNSTDNPINITMNDDKDVTATFIVTNVPMAVFDVTHAKLDFKKKPDDDKVLVQGKLELADGSSVDISEPVTVTIVDTLTEAITMVEKGKKGEKWEYKRSKLGTGNIKYMKINWKNGEFEIRMDKANLTGVSNPVTFRVQIGDNVGEEEIQMRVKKNHWDYKD